MLHTITSGWLRILVNQAIDDPKLCFLFVASDEDERDWIISSIRSYIATEYPKLTTSYINRDINISVATIETIKYERRYLAWRQQSFPMYDSILVSHELNDVMLKSFLSQHCKRKS